MTTDIDICNLALGSLGLEPITALAEEVKNARTCNLFYALIRDIYLQEHDWSFATKTIELVEIDPLPDGYARFAYGYEYPSDCLKARVIRDEGGFNNYPFIIKDYVISGPANATIILTNLSEAFLEYTVTMPTAADIFLFTSLFIEALSTKLASKIVWPLTKDLRIQKQAFEQFAIADNNAKQHDSSSQLPEKVPPTWLQSRGLV